MKLLLFTAFTFISYSILLAQDALRYRDNRFSSTTKIQNIKYGSAPQWVFPYWNVDLNLDVYQPTGDTLQKRPLIIFAHSGGFINGSKNVDDMRAICDSFARKGYVTASIDYRKGFNPLDSESAERAVYRGVQDGKAAVRFFKEKAADYNIDTNFIYFGGMSAGGYIALHVAYMTLESDRPQSTFGGALVNNLNCLDCTGNNYRHSSKVRAILDYWGAVQDTVMIRPNQVPSLIMHGINDGIVPFNYGRPFNVPTLPKTMGGGPIFQRLQNLGIYTELYTSNSDSHMLDGSDNGTFPSSGPNSFWSDTLLPRTTDFLLKYTKPNPSKISVDTLYLCTEELITLGILKEHSDHKVRWYYPSTGINLISNSNLDFIDLFATDSGTYKINALVFNEVYCASDTLTYTLIIESPNTFSVEQSVLNNQYTFSTSPETIVNWRINDVDYGSSASVNYTAETEGEINVKWEWISAHGSCNINNQLSFQHSNLAVDLINLSKWKAFPNPFNETLNISSEDPSSISIYDIQGKILYQSFIENELIIPTTNWASGIYFIEIQNQTFTEKIKVVK